MDIEDQLSLILSIALVYRQHQFLTAIRELHNHVLSLDEQHAGFIIDVILCGSYDDETLHKVFALPDTLISEVKECYLN